MKTKSRKRFLLIRCTPPQTNSNILKAYVMHSLKSLYGECGGSQVTNFDILSCSEIKTYESSGSSMKNILMNGSSESVLSINIHDEDKIRAALTIPPSISLKVFEHYAIDIIKITSDVLEL